MAELTYRDAVIRGIAQEMTRDEDVVFLGEDVAKAGGVFKATVACQAAPPPPVEILTSDVYADGGWAWRN